MKRARADNSKVTYMAGAVKAKKATKAGVGEVGIEATALVAESLHG